MSRNDSIQDNKKLRIILADDHAIVRSGLKMLIQAQEDMEVIGEADDGGAAEELILAEKPDVAILDITMPVMNGVEVAAKLKGSGVKLLVLTAHEERGYLQELMESGASGYLLKRSASQDLIQAIRTVAGGARYLDPTILTDMIGSMLEPDSNRSESTRENLSDREREVLRLISQGFTNKEIAGQLDISVKTVETYKARSMTKLNLRSRAEIVKYAIDQGWLRTQ